ncbi:MAG: orotidine-5'-phosphate decarboxylase [candidate division KSB1 bacterium]|nr:orotidine-5'-phosphate decarboxylase [candidate division KSB1 bacterium]MDZ7273158.1 orotidine-5'-phosphate decarboxylase [candidate division KSB1 bacterium]MDZ7285260.1 orotidine-5'-phosphate decarboxylase [candidate division KSB1 bacterium]MDZ7298292.1 orotidine-5'-phosphate decarboxylase [candidate division KSB1 bacterium]MDZ7306627.1 orotidine-5'-phosphate decarboxylase [candidate division KSB1 bacterium]
MSRQEEKSFTARFGEVLTSRQSLLCVGLDPEIEKLPAGLPRTVQGLVRFCREIIAATTPFAAAFKINFAFFEALGTLGWAALAEVAAALPATTLRIADAKRGDIANSARLYARALFEELPFDAVTVNPYLGADAARPFLENPARGAFFLCRTSNPGSGGIQQYPAPPGGGTATPLYLHVAEQVARWNTHDNAGLVVGATHPAELQKIREKCPHLPLLIPGVGAQGGDLESAVRVGATAAGNLAVINASRAIIYADGSSNFAEAAARQAEALRNQMRACLKAKT